MQFKTNTKQKLPFFVALGLMAVLTSCGSFQYVGYDNDGIYSSEDYDTADVEQPVTTTSTNDSDYYKNYFAENAAQIDAAKENSDIFTDIDSYEGDYLERAQDTIEERPVYGGWGQNNESITINIIDNGWYGWNDPWVWNAGWGWNSWGWNSWRWNYGWGWNNWGWNAGWGYGWNNWGWGPGWGYGWNSWGWNGYYRGNRYAYNAGRRGSMLSNNYLNRANRNTSALSRRNYSTNRLSRGATRSSRLNATTRTSRNSTTRNSSTRSSTRVTRPGTSGSSGTIRSTRSTRSSSGSVRSTRSTRSSGSVRSSRSSSSRSSGTMRSSGGSRSSSTGSSSGSRRSRG